MKIFVINLDRSTKRLQQIKSKLGTVPFERIQAIDGQKLTYDEIAKWTTTACRTIKCSKSIIGCAMSHIKAWQKVIDTDDIPFFIRVDQDELVLAALNFLKRL